MNSFTKHQHSVLETVQELIKFLSGTSDSLSFDSALHLSAWLGWRVEEGWTSGPTDLALIDNYVRELARLVAYQSSLRLIEILENNDRNKNVTPETN